MMMSGTGAQPCWPQLQAGSGCPHCGTEVEPHPAEPVSFPLQHFSLSLMVVQINGKQEPTAKQTMPTVTPHEPAATTIPTPQAVAAWAWPSLASSQPV